ncbi:MAG TPA: hypothetical protein VGO53_16245 [Steroidobacteraceae bacterium]|jgi:hypothetical protein|nr:hypothetical protein [Steroidobacteraceae bacterium]
MSSAQLTAWLLSAVAVGTFIRTALHAAIPVIRAYVDATATKKDDEWLQKWLPRYDAAIGMFDVMRRYVPGMVVGPLFANQPKATIIGRPTLPSIKPLSMPPPMPVAVAGRLIMPPPPPPMGGGKP